MVMFFLKVVFHNCTFVLSHDKGWTRFRYSKRSASCWLWSAGVWCSRLSSLGPFGICSEKSKGSCLFFFSCEVGAPEMLTQCDETAVKIIMKEKFPPSFLRVFFFLPVLYQHSPGSLGGGCLSALGVGAIGSRETLFYFHVGVLCFFFFLSWKYVVEWRYFESINKL